MTSGTKYFIELITANFSVRRSISGNHKTVCPTTAFSIDQTIRKPEKPKETAPIKRDALTFINKRKYRYIKTVPRTG